MSEDATGGLRPRPVRDSAPTGSGDAGAQEDILADFLRQARVVPLRRARMRDRCGEEGER